MEVAHVERLGEIVMSAVRDTLVCVRAVVGRAPDNF